MRIAVLTNQIGEMSGWGMYSAGLIDSFSKYHDVSVLVNKKNHALYRQFEVLSAPLETKKIFLLAPLYGFLVYLKLRKYKPQIIHSFVEPYAVVAFFAALFLRINYVLTIHGSYGVKYSNNFFTNSIQNYVLRKSKKNFCVSNYTKNRLLDLEPRAKYVVIPNGVYTNAFKSNIVDFDNKKNQIVAVGALKKRKGIDVLIMAMSLIASKHRDVKLHVVGNQSDVSYFSYIKNLIRENNLQEKIIFHEWLSDNELNELYKICKVAALTPVSDKYNFEGFGLVYLDANASGLPVIGSYGNGGEDAIRHGKTGFLVNVENPHELSNYINDLLSNKGLYDVMQKASIQWAEKHTWDLIAQKYTDLYCDII